jgi:phenylalanyl-tRNA synthetase beta chain
MLAPLSWLKEYVDLTLPVDALAERLTLAGWRSMPFTTSVIGDRTIAVREVVAVLPHPDLVLVDIAFGGDAPQVVTGRNSTSIAASHRCPYSRSPLRRRC